MSVQSLTTARNLKKVAAKGESGLMCAIASLDEESRRLLETISLNDIEIFNM